LGSINVILEGGSDQKLLVAAIQRFAKPGEVQKYLDLNVVSLISANGAPFVPHLVRKAIVGDEKPPVVVAILDGDKEGQDVVQQLTDEHLLDGQTVCTLREVPIGTVAEVVEDLLPPKLICRGIRDYLEREQIVGKADVRWDAVTTGNSATRTVALCRALTSGRLDGRRDVEIRAGVVDCIVTLLQDAGFECDSLELFRSNVTALCGKINEMVMAAELRVQHQSLKKLISLEISTFRKRFTRQALKSDVKSLLARTTQIASVHGEPARRTRENIEALRDLLGKEVQAQADPVNVALWNIRLAQLAQVPWKAPRDGWQSLAVPSAPSEPTSTPSAAGPKTTSPVT
jgi:hypothetical protein